MRDHCAALAIRLQKKINLKPGDAIGICLPNIPEYGIIVLGSTEAGLVATTVNPIYTAGSFKLSFLWSKPFKIYDKFTSTAEMSRQFLSSRPKLVFTISEIYDTVVASREIAKLDFNIVTVKTRNGESVRNGSIDFTELMSTKGNSIMFT